ncbi:MAG: DUF4037 domain-containing protein [Ktedonobacteraceae bacterium]|nr:DUF4037 domain-containing protein [Chloroflexota bacterium]
MSGLPSTATQASDLRWQLACELAQLCPPDLGREIVLTGSTSMGIADEYSDIELVFYVDMPPLAEQRADWLYEIGVEDLVLDTDPIADGSLWATFRFHDVWVEAGWQSLADHEKNLAAILSGEVLDHHALTLGWIMQQALPVCSEGYLAGWQQSLATYPEALTPRLLANATELWNFPHLVAASRALIQRGERFTLTERLLREVHNVLRILFALNQQWEPVWKWLAYTTANLALKPADLVERINAIFSSSQPEQSLLLCRNLVHDTLLLVPPVYDVSCALALI